MSEERIGAACQLLKKIWRWSDEADSQENIAEAAVGEAESHQPSQWVARRDKLPLQRQTQ